MLLKPLADIAKFYGKRLSLENVFQSINGIKFVSRIHNNKKFIRF